MTALPADLSHQLQDGQTARIVVSPNDLRQLFNQVEAEFCQSRVYQKILSWFQHQLKDNEELVSQLASTLGREAIRLTLRQLIAGASQTEPEALRPAPAPDEVCDRPVSAAQSGVEASHSSNSSEDSNPFPPLKEAQTVGSQPAKAAENGFQVSEHRSVNVEAMQTTYQAERLTDSEPIDTESADSKLSNTMPADSKPVGIGHKPAARARSGPAVSQSHTATASTLLEVGNLLKQARQQRGLTLDQLYQLTHVPKHHIQAIENGMRDRLPEEIYVRGFMRHLCNALGLNGESLTPYYAHAAEAPANSSLQQHKPQSPRLYLRPAHLYTGYATLMLGALGGLCWITWQPIADEIDWPEQVNLGAAAVDSDLAALRETVTSKLRYFELSKQRSRHLAELDSIAAPELILEQIQGIPLSEAP
ncbi:MAG: helix-turn-helix domain-containing protein [Elainellaceae cyanobacterium]